MSDPYVRKARAQGYRSRAAFKLIEVNSRERLLIPGFRVADLGAAPGGWSQVAAEKVGPRGKVVAIDLLEVAPLPGVTVLRGDFRDAALQATRLFVAAARALQAALAAELAGGKFDLVLSDLSPNLSGIASADQARSAELADAALEFSRAQLKPEGALLMKVFQGSEFASLHARTKRLFRTVRVLKPAASRGESAETYLLGRALKPTADAPISAKCA